MYSLTGSDFTQQRSSGASVAHPLTVDYGESFHTDYIHARNQTLWMIHVLKLFPLRVLYLACLH